MKKLFFIALWALLPFFQVQAQSDEYRLTEGPILKKSMRSIIVGFIYQDENMMIAIGYEKGKKVLERYNSDLTFNTKAVIKNSLKINNAKADYLTSIVLNSKVYLLYQIIDTKTDQAKLIAFELDKNSLQIGTDYVTLVDSNHKKRMQFRGFAPGMPPSSPFSVFVSKNLDRFCVFTDAELAKKENKTFDVNVYDFNMTLKSTKNIEIRYTQRYLQTRVYEVELSNNV